MKELATKAFDAKLETVFDIDPNQIKTKMGMDRSAIISFLKGHSAKNHAIEDLCKEVRVAEMKLGVKMDNKRIQGLAEIMAVKFANVALEHARQERLTDAEKTRIKREASYQKDLEEEVRDLVEFYDRSE